MEDIEGMAVGMIKVKGNISDFYMAVGINVVKHKLDVLQRPLSCLCTLSTIIFDALTAIPELLVKPEYPGSTKGEFPIALQQQLVGFSA